MKTIKSIVIVAVALFMAAANHSFAIDGLQISVQSSNAALFWPSLTNETYVVQYRHTLSTNDSWTTLDNYLTAADGTNLTSFTDPNLINLPTGGFGGGTNDGGTPTPGGTNYVSGGGTNDSVPGTGFYRVLDVRVTGGLTNGMTASDFINVATRPESGARYLELMVDGHAFPYQDLLTPPFTNENSVTFQYVDTSYLSNGGPYSVQVEGGWFVPSEENFSSGYEQAYSQPFSIYVTNEISYPEWNDIAGDGWASFDLQSAHPDVDWEIDIYNYWDYLYWYYGYTDTITPIHVATGSTTNGMIDYQWNLTDDDGNLRTNLDDDPYFFSFTYTSWTGDGGLTNESVHANEVHPNTGGGSASKANPIMQNDDWPADGGYWVVAYQDIYRDMYDDGNVMQSMFNSWLYMGGSTGNSVFYQTPTSGTNAQTFPLRYNDYTNSAFINTNSYYNLGAYYDVESLNNMLHNPHARNFYGFGHGSKDEFLGLTLAEAELTSMHRYRFVWLDVCDTAKGDWDRFFHINGTGIFGLDYYIAHHRRPALFVGHTQEIPYGKYGGNAHDGITYDGTIPSSIPYFRSNFVADWWLEGVPFRSALNYAINNTPAIVPAIVFQSGPLKGVTYVLGN